MILLTAACREEVQGWDLLSQEEKDEITTRAKERCNETNAAPKVGFKETSGGIFDSTSYQRNYGYINKLMKDSAEVSSVDLRVWKQDTTNNVLYFYVTEKVGATENSYFLKVNQVQNEEIIDDLVADYCDNSLYSSLSADEDGPMVVTYVYDKTTTSLKTYTDTYTFQFSNLAFMGAYSLARKIQTKDSAGTVTATENYTSTYVQQTYNWNFSAAYTDYTQSFCELAEETTGVYRFSKSVIGFKLGTCSTTLPAGWDLSV